jgi:hypothetical protein
MDSAKPVEIQREFKGMEGCTICDGTGFKISKKKEGKKKPCKKCVEATGHCPKCNNTGIKLGGIKPCSCKTKDKKDFKKCEEKGKEHKQDSGKAHKENEEKK